MLETQVGAPGHLEDERQHMWTRWSVPSPLRPRRAVSWPGSLSAWLVLLAWHWSQQAGPLKLPLGPVSKPELDWALAKSGAGEKVGPKTGGEARWPSSSKAPGMGEEEAGVTQPPSSIYWAPTEFPASLGSSVGESRRAAGGAWAMGVAVLSVRHTDQGRNHTRTSHGVHGASPGTCPARPPSRPEPVKEPFSPACESPEG